MDRIALDTQAFERHPLAPTQQPKATRELGTVKSVLDIDPKLGQSQPSGLIPLGFIPKGVTGFVMEIDSYGMNDDIQLFSRDGKHIAGTSVSADSTWADSPRNVTTEKELEAEIFTEDNGFLPRTRYDGSMLLDGTGFFESGGVRATQFRGMSIAYSGDGHPTGDYTERLVIRNVSEPLFVLMSGSGAFQIDRFEVDYAPPKPIPTSGPIDIVTSASFGDELQKITIEPTPADSETLGLNAISLASQTTAAAALTSFDQALGKVDTYRGQYGALTIALSRPSAT
ncbi:hypothetical protein [Billgrantia saliphila]|uniref:hypothetical protein n=1 Tax=Billgrantia saliphila TaxID=1848458 RepID=UPI000CE37E36|nr:hypothetical protein [Halomonas saliphila]